MAYLTLYQNFLIPGQTIQREWVVLARALQRTAPSPSLGTVWRTPRRVPPLSTAARTAAATTWTTRTGGGSPTPRSGGFFQLIMEMVSFQVAFCLTFHL